MVGRYADAAAALASLTAREPSIPRRLALASVLLQLGDLEAAARNLRQVIDADPQRPGARFMLGRVNAALDDRAAALADFRAALDLHVAQLAALPGGPVPVHYALHNLEQLAYIEAARGGATGDLLPGSAANREEMRRRLGEALDKAGTIVPSASVDGELGRVLAQPPVLWHDEPAPPSCLSSRNDWTEVAHRFHAESGMACVDDFLSPQALAQLQRFMLLSTVWRQPNRHGYIGGLAEHGFFNELLLQVGAELKRALPELLAGHHLTYWWGFVYQHQRPGTDIHADQSDISLNMWLTPDAANLEPERGGLDLWDVAAPADWTFAEYNSGAHRIRMFLDQAGARRHSFAYRENRALLFRGSLFHQTAAGRFAEGFENRRRNVTMLFRRTRRV